jgi:hypothetical protein
MWLQASHLFLHILPGNVYHQLITKVSPVYQLWVCILWCRQTQSLAALSLRGSPSAFRQPSFYCKILYFIILLHWLVTYLFHFHECDFHECSVTAYCSLVEWGIEPSCEWYAAEDSSHHIQFIVVSQASQWSVAVSIHKRIWIWKY